MKTLFKTTRLFLNLILYGMYHVWLFYAILGLIGIKPHWVIGLCYTILVIFALMLLDRQKDDARKIYNLIKLRSPEEFFHKELYEKTADDKFGEEWENNDGQKIFINDRFKIGIYSRDLSGGVYINPTLLLGLFLKAIESGWYDERS